MSPMPEENRPGTENTAGVGGVNGVEELEQGGQVRTGSAEDTPRVVELLEEVRKEEWNSGSDANGTGFRGYGKIKRSDEVSHDDGSVLGVRPAGVRPESPEGSFSIPDDTPSVQGSILSSPASSGLVSQASTSRFSLTPSLRPFDRRFQSRISSLPLNSSRPPSPALLNSHSRQLSLSSNVLQDQGGTDTGSTPWDVVRWTKLQKITGQAFSEVGKRNFGRPTCISVSASIAVGTSKGIILVFDYNQSLKSIIGPGTKAIESGAITALATSADHSTLAGGHANGSIFTWELTRSARPFLQIPPLLSSQLENRKVDGHAPGVSIIHIGFLGTRHTALVSADDRGMAFSHLATRGLGAVARTIKTTRILGRYPNDIPTNGRPRKPSSVLAFSPLPLGNAEQSTDTIGLVAMLTPYLLVIVSTTPIAQTQHKAARPKEVAAHSVLSGCLAWFPAVKLKVIDPSSHQPVSKPKLVYCWSNVLTVLDVNEVEPSEPADKDRPPGLQFRPRSRWKAEEAIVAVQWLSRSVLAVLTISQRLIILEDNSLRMTETFDLIHKHIFHQDVFSKQLQPLVEQLDEDEAMHGVVADAFHPSFRSYKGRMFLLGFDDISVGTLSNWADRLTALISVGDYIQAIQLATSYYIGDINKLTVGLPDDSALRHPLVQEKLLDMMSASLEYAFRHDQDTGSEQAEKSHLEELAAACFTACIGMNAIDFLFSEVYEWYEQNSAEGMFLETLEPYILNGQIRSIPPIVVKGLVTHFTSMTFDSRLEELICHLDTATMDIDQITALCKKHHLYDALIYVWNRAIGDYISPLIELLSLLVPSTQVGSLTNGNGVPEPIYTVSALKIFPYLSYTLTSRIYPTGEDLSEREASRAKAELYYFLFSGKTITWPKAGGKPFLTGLNDNQEHSFPYLRLILKFDAPSFLSALNEAFEDGFLNGSPDRMVNGGSKQNIGEDQVFGLSVNRQYIVSILLEVMSPVDFPPHDIIYLEMFIARNLPKFPQFILLSGTSLQRVMVGLCNYPGEDIAEDCQLSVEYLLSVYHPPDIESLIPLLYKAGFFRVLKFIYRTDKQYPKLLQTYFDDKENQDTVFDCIGDCLRPRSGLNDRQLREVRSVIEGHARDLTAIDTIKTAKAINAYAPDLHKAVLEALEEASHEQFSYLRTILEPEIKGATEVKRPAGASNNRFIERYVRLMCMFDTSHVMSYIGMLQSGDLRLERVLPAMESGGVIDAAVILMAREGLVKEAMERLIAHLGTLEAAILGLLATEGPDAANREEAAADLLEGLQKYSRVGVWLCQGQTKTMQKAHIKMVQPLDKKELSTVELLWLDLIDAVVRIAKNVSAALQVPHENVPQPSDSASSMIFNPQGDSIVSSLRTLVQQTFTALLSATTTIARIPGSQSHSSIATNISFLRILRSFLNRASLSSPSLSDLRAVLAAIFSAYVYEESLLALANRLLDKDLFVHVAEATELRQRGWRPKGLVCEGCGKRVWGPGAGGRVWDAWEERRYEEDRKREEARGQLLVGDDGGRRDRGKARAAFGTGGEEGDSRTRSSARSTSSRGKRLNAELRPGHAGSDEDDDTDDVHPSSKGEADNEDEEFGPLVIFSCRHTFHRKCLERLQAEQEQNQHLDFGLSVEFTCMICR
ncbi:MAG: Vacuolar protein sorting-associated protein 8 [Trichoglossum hirsutum]|nr:MAG: Vacuolar protein sorting-associated protein 8 [Trichoglossum hirsutum]